LNQLLPFKQVKKSVLSEKWIFSVVVLFLLIFFLKYSPVPDVSPEDEKRGFVVVDSFPHDPEAFTQGLAWDKGSVYEGTGKRGRSSLRRVDLQTGQVTKKIENKRKIFGEGITVFGDKIFQLTWKNKVVYTYDKDDFSLVRSYTYPRQGWGITHDNHDLIVSDGTSTIYFLHPETLREKRRISVRSGTKYVQYINELEYVQGKLYANIWKSDRMAIINMKSGAVERWVDFSSLRRQIGKESGPDVLNGIMYDPEGDRLFVTGKFLSRLFEIKLIPGE